VSCGQPDPDLDGRRADSVVWAENPNPTGLRLAAMVTAGLVQPGSDEGGG
jgi:hypothetical protein